MKDWLLSHLKRLQHDRERSEQFILYRALHTIMLQRANIHSVHALGATHAEYIVHAKYCKHAQIQQDSSTILLDLSVDMHVHPYIINICNLAQARPT